jgi:hypothetical protein
MKWIMFVNAAKNPPFRPQISRSISGHSNSNALLLFPPTEPSAPTASPPRPNDKGNKSAMMQSWLASFPPLNALLSL